MLKTWALPQLPEPGLEIPCDALADHRPLYLDYEGPISGGRGTVARWDHGTYRVELWRDDEIIVELAGAKLAGRVELRRAGRSNGSSVEDRRTETENSREGDHAVNVLLFLRP